jgi:hypothetical protein
MIVRSIRGETIDFTRLVNENGDEVALGNAMLNARGDLLDKRGRVIQTREEIKSEYHRNKRSVKQVPIKALDTEVFQTPAQALETLAASQKTAKAEKPEKPEPKGKSRKIVEKEDD